MQDLESLLLDDGVARGRKPVFIQLATAAGREGEERLEYWRDLGARQAEQIGVEVEFLPVIDRAGAMNSALAERARDAALTYFSGGDPHHLAESLHGTPLWSAVEANHQAGGSLAGCSAGAMFLSAEVPSLRFLRKTPIPGMGLIPQLQVVPHYDMIHHWIPDAVVRLATRIPDGVTLVGIDEQTALVRRPDIWRAWGRGGVHVINGNGSGPFRHGEDVPAGLA